MRLLEDARRIVESDPSIDDMCVYCHENVGLKTLSACGEHAADCPWLAMPKIIAALEVAVDLLAVSDYVRRDHYPKTIKNGPFQTCDAYCSTWPCDAVKMDGPANTLRTLLNSDGAAKERHLDGVELTGR